MDLAVLVAHHLAALPIGFAVALVALLVAAEEGEARRAAVRVERD